MPASPARQLLSQRYRLDRILGRGATAEVWRATDTRDGSSVCVKRLHADLAADQTARDRLAAEHRAARQLSHPGLLPILDADLEAEQPFLVFPCVDGEALAQRLAREVRLEPWQAARLTAQLAEALAAVHARGLVHRDVKPGNVLLGRDGRARLLDFGISSPQGTPAALSGGAGVGRTVGTLPYMAPEQLAGEPAQPANDVFALGAVLYQALSGRPPFDAQTAPELARAQSVAPARIADAPAALTAIALAALEPQPDARPTAARLAHRLNAWLSGGLLSDAPTVIVAAAGARKPIRLGRGAVYGGALAGLALAVGLALALPSVSPSPPARETSAGLPATVPQVSPNAHVEVRVADRAPAAVGSRPVAIVGGIEPEPRAGPAGDKPKGEGKPGRGKDESKAKDKGKGGDGESGKAKGKGKGKGRGR